MLLQPSDAVGVGEAGKSKEEIVAEKVERIIGLFPETGDFPISELNDRNPDAQPFNSVCIQECTRMNILIKAIRNSLLEL